MTTTTKYHTCEIDGELYPTDECRPLHDGGWIHEDNIDGSNYILLTDGELYAHSDDCIICECDGEYYLEDEINDNDIAWDNYDECWRFIDNMVYGHTHDGEGWFNSRSDYVYSDSRDQYYMNEDVAREYDMEYCENRGEWVHIDDMESGDEWTNQWKINSKTFKHTHGMKYTFGVEIETCDGYMDYQDDLSLSCVPDGSIEGMEYVTGVLQGDKGLEMLKSICNRLNDNNCYVDKSCGLHVHIGGANFNRKFSILSLMLGQMIQNEVFKIIPPSRSSSNYCYKIKHRYKEIKYVNKKLYPRTHSRTLKLLAEYVHSDTAEFGVSNNKNTAHPYGRYHSSRYTWINLNNCSYKFTPDTIEFRCHSGTTDYKKMYNWILICMCFVSFIENNPRKIIEEFKGYNPDEMYKIIPSSKITLKDIISAGIKSEIEAKKLLDYVEKRKEKFGNN
jgi:hypothetical protein